MLLRAKNTHETRTWPSEIPAAFGTEKVVIEMRRVVLGRRLLSIKKSKTKDRDHEKDCALSFGCTLFSLKSP